MLLNVSWQIARAEFKLKNEGSYLGLVWYLLNPVLLFTLLFFIFLDRLGSSIPDYAPYLFLGIIMFNFFQSSTLESGKTFIKENNYLIKSINFPRQALIIAIVLKNLLSHLFEVLLFAILLLYFHLNLANLLYYLIIMVPFCLFIFGFCLALSSLTVFFADLGNIWNFAVRILWFGTPILYAVNERSTLLYINLFNPLYYFITLTRELVIYGHSPSVSLILGTIFWSLAFLLLGTWIFATLNKKIPELI